MIYTEPENDKPEIIFSANSEDWVMKLTRDGIIFNKERYPEATPDHFAEAVIGILEEAFDVEFKRKLPSFDKKEDE